MTYYDAATGKAHFLNAGFNTPVEEKDPLSIPKMDPLKGGGTPSGRTALVPGFMAGVQAAHDRFGKLPFRRVIEPAIALAEAGFDVDPHLAGSLRYRKDVLSRLPETRRVFAKQDGTFYARGDRFRSPNGLDLGQVATHGAAYLYTGDGARRFVNAVRRDGGRITLRDMGTTGYLGGAAEDDLPRRPHFAPGPLRRRRRYHRGSEHARVAALKTLGPPAKSARSLLRLLQMANNQVLSYETELITKRYPGRDLSPRARATKESARWIWDEIRAGRWPYAIEPAKGRPSHSSGVVAVDRRGNVAAVTHSIYTAIWGNTGIFVAGISIPDPAAFLQDAIESTGPGRRLPDATARSSSPATANPSWQAPRSAADCISVTSRSSPTSSNSAWTRNPPSMHPLSCYRSGRRIEPFAGARGAFDPKVLDEVRTLGQPVKELSPEERDMFIGYWAGIAIDPKTGIIRAAGTAELPSHAEGY